MKRRHFLALGLSALAHFVETGCRRSTTDMPANTVSTSLTDTEAASTPRFVDVASRSGIQYRWVIPGPRPLNILQTIGNGCAFLDFNNDGNLDILLVGPQLALYQGDGKGHFEDVTKATGLDKLHGHYLGCAVGDYDNDGYVDIYITAYRGGVLLHNEGGKRFVDVTAQSGIAAQPWGTSAAWVPLTNDGYLDLFIGNYVEFGPHTDPQLCSNAGKMTACGPRFYKPVKGVLYKNRGRGHFENVSKIWGLDALHGKDLGVTTADYDGSGRQSISVANDEVEGDLMQNVGGRFKNMGAISGTAYSADGNVHGGMGTDWGDYDNDGKLDLVVATFQHEAKCIYHNDGSGLFTECSAQLGMADIALPYVSFGTKFFDYDNDGWLDLIIVSGHVQDNIAEIDKSTTYRQTSLLLHNQNGTRFVDVTSQAGPDLLRPIVGRGLAIGDYDNDGRLDVLAVDSEGSPLLFHNETPKVGNWVLCRLEGRKSNRDGLGALLTVKTPGGKRYLRRCQTDGSYMSASDKRVHCGVGDANEVEVEVRWPSGQIDTHKSLATNRIYTFVEGGEKLG